MEDCLTRYIAASPDRWAYQWLAGCYHAEGDEVRWKSTLDEFLTKTEDAGLDHARVRVQLANAFIAKEQWAEAKAYAEAAAQTWAGWSMLCAAKANEGLHDWDRAEYWYTQAAERYPSSAWQDLFLFRQRIQCVRPGSEPDDAKARLNALAAAPASIQSGESGYIYWLNDSPRKALEALEAAYQAAPRVNLATAIMLVADELGDAARRDSAREDLCSKLKDQAPKTCAICQLICDSLAAETRTPLDLAPVDKILDTIQADARGNAEFIVGRFLLNRGRTDDARKYLQRCADSANGSRWTRTMAAKLVRAPDKR
ncbi:hypothetical protein [Paludisphaera borealis]|uniref:Beta-barrel assembly-enhancing protease n=1 Tax=Paludisphaera borealis TaxID=1387353 RepID=A0A1U7CNV4_9BACT|nr:hypothetical protein [Paludisphaera borealis]APW60563.1 hypothetical protein BSF38_02038 [Paludisphaera borealis]